MTTLIDAPVERCFRLSLSIDLHLKAAERTGERVLAGVSSGLIRAGETVTWSGKHFGLRLQHTTVIDGWRPYTFFRDTMSQGRFAHFAHEHHFAPMNDGTRMRDDLQFAAPFGRLGLLFEGRLRTHLRQFLVARNTLLKHVAESASEDWRQYLDHQPPLDLTPFRKPTS